MSGGYVLPSATGEGEIIDPSGLARRRRIAEALIAQGTDFSPVQSPLQGLARVAQAGLGGYESGQLDREEKTARESGKTDATALLGTLSPAAATVSSALAPAPATTSSISPTGGITDFAKAIQSNESGGNYGAVGPTHPKYGRPSARIR